MNNEPVEILSVVIVRVSSKGVIASLRFSDRSYDRDMAFMQKFQAYEAIERYINRIVR